MQGINWTERKNSEKMLTKVQTTRISLSFPKLIENHKVKMLGYLIRHDNFLTSVIEGKIEENRAREDLDEFI